MTRNQLDALQEEKKEYDIDAPRLCAYCNRIQTKYSP
jgi:hypothetical protein